MTEKNSKTPDLNKETINIDDIATDVSDVVVSILGIGTAVAKIFAEATSGGKKLPKPEDGSGPINVIVHYGMTGITNMLGVVVGTVKSKEGLDAGIKQSEESVSKPQTDSFVPLVEKGATLRIPLSIENPGGEPMLGMVFSCTTMESEPTAPGRPLTKEALHFQPNVLNVAPKDFEKLTVFIETSEDTAPGDYTAIIGMGIDTFESKVHFKVV